jgi:hypothetical protein
VILHQVKLLLEVLYAHELPVVVSVLVVCRVESELLSEFLVHHLG